MTTEQVAHPERFCAAPRCLWSLRSGPCAGALMRPLVASLLWKMRLVPPPRDVQATGADDAGKGGTMTQAMTPREILEEVKRRITKAPETYSQTNFCGTPCCVAGHIDCILNGEEEHERRNLGLWNWLQDRNFEATHGEINKIAASALGVQVDHWIFNGIDEKLNADDDDSVESSYFWPYDLNLAYNEADDSAERAKVGVMAIDRFIKERGL